MSKGHQIIATYTLDLLVGRQRDNIFTVAVLHWLVQQLNSVLKEQLDGIQIEIVKLVHHSPHNKYPWIGIHYERPSETPDIGPLVEETIDRLLEGATLLDFMRFISKSDKDWKAVTATLMGDE
jgi:hypothetical protein